MNEIIDLAKIEQFAQEVGLAINTLVKFTDLLRNINESLNHIKKSQEHTYLIELQKLRGDVTYMREQLERVGLPKINTYEKDLNAIKELLSSPDWPEAIDIAAIDNDQKVRATKILELVVTDFLHDTRFLDFGCGDGHVAHAAISKSVKLSVGYDIKQEWANFPPTDKFLLTTNFQEVVQQAPYDIVLLFDVLDHYKGNPVEGLCKIREIMRPGGRLYVRTHPWCSRNGTHLYKDLNKAYVHLILDEVELSRIGGYVSDHTVKLTQPIKSYREWFQKADFAIKSEIVITNDVVEPFFTSRNNSIIIEKIARHWHGIEDPTKYLQLQYIDYVLTPNKSEVYP